MHIPVLLQETLQGLDIKPDGVYIDGTFGRGGHSLAILQALSPKGRLIALDKDKEAIFYAKEHFGKDNRFSVQQSSFANMSLWVEGKVDGIVLDLGVSSPQLDTPERGFSFLQAGPLDMRMDQNQLLDAQFFINHTEEKEMVRVFREYGEERFAGRIARAIVQARKEEPITTTTVLAEVVKKAHPRWEKHKHPATRVFQAIRIYVNQELMVLPQALEEAFSLLVKGGRLCVISFHSLEDRIVKQFMREKQEGPQLLRALPLRENERNQGLKRIGKAIKPSDVEIKTNPRSRSAVLRIGEKLL